MAKHAEYPDIPYASQDEQQKLDLYLPAEHPYSPPLLVFVHGGAWRTGSRKDHISLARHLASSGQIAVAVIGYRLTVLKSEDGPDEPFHKPIYENQHPAHVDDLFAALQFLVLTQPREGEPCSYYDRNCLILVGHSVGAWMASALLLESGHYHSNIPALATSPCAARLLRRSIVGWILIDGIYDLESLLREYPDYRSFVSQAIPGVSFEQGHDDRAALQAASILTWLPAPVGDYHGGRPPIVRVLHSREDELLTPRQSEEAAKYLCSVFFPDLRSSSTDATTSKSKLSADMSTIRLDLDTLKGKHDALLQDGAFFDFLQGLVLQDAVR
ncbi:unnamed protein product [Jaminaea pallidilutea]